MYYPTFNSYDNEINIITKRETIEVISNSDEQHDCLICWDRKNVYKMQSFAIITNSCKCNGLFHGGCLFKWVYETNSCPICRRPSEFNIKLISRFLNRHKRENDIDNFVGYTERQNKFQIAVLIIFNIIRIFMRFVLYLLFYAFLFSFIAIGKNEIETSI